MSVAQCESAAWAIAPGATRIRYWGAGAINLALAVALGTPLPIWFYALPGVRHVQDGIYAWVARNRHRLPGDVPYCDQYPARCS